MDILNEWLRAGVSSGLLEIKQILLFIFIAGPLVIIIRKIREIIAFINEVRNSKLNELQHLLNSHKLPKEESICIKDEITRIIGYRMTGIADVARQQVIIRLLVKHRFLISADFFKKFRSFLVVEDSFLVFKKGISYWVENGMYGLFSLQFLFFSITSIVLSINKEGVIPVWGHFILYFVAVMMFLFFIAFARMIPRPGECKLLDKILQTQYNNSSE
ncbi:hypothetical protein EHN07_06505 [Buttiauxella warmboldiae]|uniref:Uncharacterized protein n=1 Tax=Buttiauxella warmboldiae TaxID=82993 RepID=A0A3N5EC81_9ENTR|nr:hypothetical protein [Buttiauxella warmboldiae]RPH29296.1 hypothetical protein EHN07_06505 [Buttiauxella warmboldiae]